jgi:hypothetical protein
MEEVKTELQIAQEIRNLFQEDVIRRTIKSYQRVVVTSVEQFEKIEMLISQLELALTLERSK